MSFKPAAEFNGSMHGLCCLGHISIIDAFVVVLKKILGFLHIFVCGIFAFILKGILQIKTSCVCTEAGMCTVKFNLIINFNI